MLASKYLNNKVSFEERAADLVAAQHERGQCEALRMLFDTHFV